ARIGKIVGEDWGWWRTVTGNLDKLVHLGSGEHSDLVPAARRFDPIAQAKHVWEFCDACPKTLKWKVRSKVGDRVQWYELPEEVGHWSRGAAASRPPARVRPLVGSARSVDRATVACLALQGVIARVAG